MARNDQAVALLKECKAQGLTYYDATQRLAGQGFTQEEIEQASYQFPYSEPSAPDAGNSQSSLDGAISQAIAKEHAKEEAKHELRQDIAMGLIGGRGAAGRFFSTKAVSDYAMLKDVETVNQAGINAPGENHSSKKYVFQRHRAVKYFAILSLIPLLILLPYSLALLASVPSLIGTLVREYHKTGTLDTTIALFLWSAIGCISYCFSSAVLFLAKRESTIVRSIYILMVIDIVLFALFAVLFKSLIVIVVGLVVLAPNYWINKRVGLLSQLVGH